MFAYLNKALKLLFITNEFYFTFQLLICSTIIAFNHTGNNFKYKMFINDFFYWINNIQSTNDLLSVAIYKCTRNYKKNINLSLSLGKTLKQVKQIISKSTLNKKSNLGVKRRQCYKGSHPFITLD